VRPVGWPEPLIPLEERELDGLAALDAVFACQPMQGLVDLMAKGIPVQARGMRRSWQGASGGTGAFSTAKVGFALSCFSRQVKMRRAKNDWQVLAMNLDCERSS
jgi:hypothetical protein